MRIDKDLLPQIIAFVKNKNKCSLKEIEFGNFNLKKNDFYSTPILEMRKESIILYHLDFLIDKEELKICV